MEDWLQTIIRESKEEAQKELKASGGQPARVSMKFEVGKEEFGLDVDLSEMVEKVVLPIRLLEKSHDGMNNVLRTLDMELKTDCKLKGYSGSEYTIPFYLKDESRACIKLPDR